MGDVLRSAVVMGGTGNGGSMFGIVTLHDNHGNSTRGGTLSCVGHKPLEMSTDAWLALHHVIDPFALLAFNFNGTIPLPDGVESPLQTMCRKTHAKTHHAR